MYEQLNEYLLDGEEIRWSGRPSPFRLLRVAGRTDLVLIWGLSLLLFLISCAAMYSLPTDSGFGESLFVFACISLLPLIMSLRPIWDKRTLEQNTIYAITDRRVIALVNGQLMDIPLSPLLRAEVEPQGADFGILRLSTCADWDFGSTLANAVSGIPSGTSRHSMKGLLLYHVPHPNKLLAYLS